MTLGPRTDAPSNSNAGSEENKSLFRQALEKEIDERDREKSRANNRFMHALRPPEGLSREEEQAWFEEQRLREEMRSLVEGPINGFFRDMMKEMAKPLFLLQLPLQLASDRTFGTNTLMRVLADKTISKERLDTLREISSMYTPRDLYISTDAWTAMYNHIHRAGTSFSATNLAECYWMLQLAKHFNQVLPEFDDVMEKALTYWVSVDELDFIKPLDPANQRDALLQDKCLRQSAKLEGLFKYFS